MEEQKIRRVDFIILVAVAAATVALWLVPGGNYILWPFTILGTWFHEMGHGLTAMFLGGQFIKLEIFPNGSGLARYALPAGASGLAKAAVAAGGPLGPSLAGAIFLAVSRNKTAARVVLVGTALMMFLSLTVWVRTFAGVAVIVIFAMALFMIGLRGKPRLAKLSAQILGVQACASVYLSVGYLFSTGADLGSSGLTSDTEFIAQYLFLPHWIWAIFLLALSAIFILFGLYVAYKKVEKTENLDSL